MSADTQLQFENTTVDVHDDVMMMRSMCLGFSAQHRQGTQQGRHGYQYTAGAPWVPAHGQEEGKAVTLKCRCTPCHGSHFEDGLGDIDNVEDLTGIMRGAS